MKVTISLTNYSSAVILDAIETTVKLIVLKTPSDFNKRFEVAFETCVSPSSIRWYVCCNYDAELFLIDNNNNNNVIGLD